MEFSPRLINKQNLDKAIVDLQSGFERETADYKKTLLGLGVLLNECQQGSLTRIDSEEPRTQTGNLLYYHTKDYQQAIPFDLEYLFLLRSHFRNPTILVLRRIRKFLMPAHRRVLARFEEEQVRERQIHFTDLDVNKKMRQTLDEMQRYQTMAQLAGSVTRKLDILTKAVQTPANALMEFKILEGIFDDKHHLRHTRAMDWLSDSVCRGDLTFLKKLIEKGFKNIERKSGKLIQEMGEASGLSLGNDISKIERGNWYSLSMPLQRGEDFLKVFEGDAANDQLGKASFFPLKPTYDAAWFQTRKDELVPDPKDMRHYSGQLSSLYFEVERCLDDSSKADGKIRSAIEADLDFAVCTQEEAEDARTWVNRNKIKLQSLLITLFEELYQLKTANPELALSERLEEMIRNHEPEAPEATEIDGLIPKIPTKDLKVELGELLEKENHAPLLGELLAVRKKILAWEDYLGEMEFHQQLRSACAHFEEYEAYLLKFNYNQERLEQMRTTCEDRILACYYGIAYRGLPQSLIDDAFQVVVDRMFHRLRKLDYQAIGADRYRDLFEKCLDGGDDHIYAQLDMLLREIHAVPSQNRLLMVLGEWETAISKETFEEKQMYLMENEFLIQEVIDDIRAELRERMQKTRLESRRLRFDVFGLADSYEGNLRDLLEGLARLIPTIATEREGEFFLESIQAIESQVIEAQRVTQPNGEAHRRIRELERAQLFSSDFIRMLRHDLEDNFKQLDLLLEDINKALTRVRKQQNRFGGNHDLEPFSLTINLRDVEQLKGIYNFVENITMMDIKRFAAVFKHKDAMMAKVFKQAYEGHPTAPALLRKAIKRRVYKAFISSKNVSVDLKILILSEVRDILEAEAELLARLLNFVENDKIHKKSMYQGILQILEAAQKADPKTLSRLQSIWLRYLKQINSYTAMNYRRNYDYNKKRLIRDSKEIIGNLFDK